MSGRKEVNILRTRLLATLARAPHATADIEVQADFAKYFSILVSGYLENALIALVLDVAQKRSAPEISLFVERQLEHWTNPNCDKIIQLLGNFSLDWRIAAEAYLIDERKSAVNSLVALRNRIAHGESVGTSLAQAKSYYTHVQEVICYIADLVNA